MVATDQIARAFFANAARWPTKTAISCGERALSYRELAEDVARWSRAAHDRGLHRGDRIGAVLNNCIELVTLMLVCADIGAALVPISPSLPAAAIIKGFEAVGVRHVVADSATIVTLRPMLSLPGQWIAIDGAPGDPSALATLLANAPRDGEQVGTGMGGDAFILTMTSGSTGDPKPIVLTQENKVMRARAAIAMYGVTSTDRVLAATPLYHSLAERLVLIPLLIGATAILMPTFSSTAWLECLKRERVTFTIAISSQLIQIARLLGESADACPSDLRCIVSSSAALETAAKLDLVAKLKCEFHECYGASEIAIATTLDVVREPAKRASVGRGAPGVEIVILDDSETPCPTDQPGEIACKSRMLCAGYLGRPELFMASLWNGYFKTGDIGRLDSDGYLHFMGRKKEIVIVGGVNVYPADVEAAVLAGGDVAECVAFALADATLGEAVSVALVPKQRTTFDLKRLRFHCARNLADYQQPRKWFILEALPRNHMGKLVRRDLTARFSQDVSA